MGDTPIVKGVMKQWALGGLGLLVILVVLGLIGHGKCW